MDRQPEHLVAGRKKPRSTALPGASLVLLPARDSCRQRAGRNIAAGLGLGGNESYPDLFQPYGGFPDVVKVENGFVTLPELPGIGFEGKADLYREMQKLSA